MTDHEREETAIFAAQAAVNEIDEGEWSQLSTRDRATIQVELYDAINAVFKAYFA